MDAHTRVTISLPRGLADRMDELCRSDHRTRSVVLQEALRAYLAPRSPSAPRSEAPVDARLHERMAARMLEQSRLSKDLIDLRDAMAPKRLPRAKA